MQPYSARPAVAALQVLWDLAAVGTLIAAIWVSEQVRAAIASFGGFGRQIEDAGAGFATTLSGAGDALAQVPFIGEGVAQPFRDASGSATELSAAGESLRGSVEALAAAVGTALWLLPALLLVLIWLVPRVRGALRAASTARMAATPGGRDLLALRALVAQPAARVLRVAPDPAAALRAGDAAVLEALAALEIRSAGARRRGDRVS
ncbi:hypothetical protein OVA14_10945 [Agrococcus sp. SL85]|uniref:hypothetical protein n=1 Tax=Agrococcus sp. SL85 TaxID=2995141 RepID=UPI00226CAC99|nr:hypothetical protein [Agrococcus sp. SL85]WAC65817.1 hypothetical protein OVA14_10945 [Agrococcus sp. SL85]